MTVAVLRQALEEILCCHDGNQPIGLQMGDLDYARRTIREIHRIARAALSSKAPPVVSERSDEGNPATDEHASTITDAHVSCDARHADGLAEATRQLIALRLNRPTHADLCRLSVMFGRSSDLRTDQDIRINEWLKAQIADAKGEL